MDSNTLDDEITMYRAVLDLLATQDSDHGRIPRIVGIMLHSRFEQEGDVRDLNEAIKLYREAVAFHTLPDPDDATLNNLAAALLARFRQLGDSEDLDNAIKLHQEVVALHETAHPNHYAHLYNLALALETKFERYGDPDDLNTVIQLHREAVALLRPVLVPDTDPSRYFNGLGNVICMRFQQQGDPKDIEEAIELYREAFAHGHDNSTLENLALAIQGKFEQQGDTKDLYQAIELHRGALTLSGPSDPDRGRILNHLATTVRMRFEQQGNSKDLDNAIKLHRESLALHAPPHLARADSLSNLAIAVKTRFQERGDPRDVDEAIQLLKEALDLRASPHLARGISLNNLASAIQTRFEQQRDPKDIDDATAGFKKGLALRAEPHPKRGSSLNNLATALQMRFDMGEQTHSQDISEVIDLYRQVLAVAAPQDVSGCMTNMANGLQTRFEKQGDLSDIRESIQMHREVVALHTPPHPRRGWSLYFLGLALVTMYKSGKDPLHSQGDLTHGCDLLQEATTYLSSSPLTRFNHARSWAIAVRFYHSSCLPAYHIAIELLHQVAALHLDPPSRRGILSTRSCATLASAAAACAVDMSQYNTAVEFLEAGRSVFWSQALRLQTPLDVLSTVRPDLSGKLTDLARQLEQAAFRDTSRNLSTDTQHKVIAIELEGARCRQLNEDWEEVVKSVRIVDGFEDFMRSKGITALQEAAISGPIVILTADTSLCFALIVTSSKVQCLKFGWSWQIFWPTFLDLATFDTRLFGGREESLMRSSDDVFRALLADLWKNLVKPVFDALNFQASKDYDSPRLWWCLTGPFAFLPLHAAGIYGKDMTDCASDYVVSSYTPTLTALLDPPTCNATSFKLTAVIQPHTTGCAPLPGARQELKKIAERVPNQWLTSLVDTTVETALLHLRESTIAHFACHVIQDFEQPLDSGLILSDGRHLKVSEIMRRPEGDSTFDVRKSMSLAFLSACETAKGDQSVPDEAIHLAATLLFAGFRGVVATMWWVD
ncbi:CHAT domain-containing protein [Mycena vulgaris]|nr:CHAT domain-containing protein [Mycena vulgaris]